MADVATLIERVESLREGGLPDDGNKAANGLGTVGFWRRNTAAVRCSSLASHTRHQPINQRLACELCDNIGTILAALRFWAEQHSTETINGQG